ncbi:GlsB/YeaQ/YmgE family stress response membrane protein [Virgibacillus kimchii]
MQLLVYIIVAIIVGLIMAALFGFKYPGKWIGAVVAGLLGAWIGDVLIRELGPTVGGYYIFPATLGAIVVTLIIGLLGRKANVKE